MTSSHFCLEANASRSTTLNTGILCEKAMIPKQTEDPRVTERDFLRYSPDSQGNPLGLPFYTEARDL